MKRVILIALVDIARPLTHPEARPAHSGQRLLVQRLKVAAFLQHTFLAIKHHGLYS